MEEQASAEIQEANALRIDVNSPSGNEIPNGEVDRETNASIGNGHQDSVLANNITQMIEIWEPPFLRNCRIYRVPHVIRKVNEEAYTPQIISIGPFHHGNERLVPMEELKVNYFKLLIKNSALKVENSLSTIRGMERDVRRCYGETNGLSSDNYVKMILLDASFIIVFFLISNGEEWKVGSWSRERDDNLIASQRSIAMLDKDFWLLENQLPFFVIHELYNLAFPSPSNYPSFKELTFRFFKHLNFQEMLYDPNLQMMHFIDLLRTIFLPKELPRRKYRELELYHLHTASQLHEAGVKFKMSSSQCLFNLKFTDGVLEIPRFTLYRERVFFFRNLMALEQCHYLEEAYVSDYVQVLTHLVNTAKDVNLLVQKGIMLYHLSENNAVTTLINNLCTYHVCGDTNSNYYALCKDLNEFYEHRWHRWKATLKRDYFGNPWSTSATLATIILLVLTLIQTVCSIISIT